jgi:hypothetical protein
MPRSAAKENENIIRVVSSVTITDKELSNLLFFFGKEKKQALKELIDNVMQQHLLEITIENSCKVEELRSDFFKPKGVDLSKPTDKKEEKAA